MSPEILYNSARSQGLFLEYWDNSAFRVTPAENLDPVFEQILIAHRESLVPWLRERAEPWLHLAKQICLGEFDGAPASQIEILSRGLIGDNHPLRQAALERLIHPNET